MTDRSRQIALDFVKRASRERSAQQKLLCLYDAYVCLYGPSEALSRASSESGIDSGKLSRMIDSCREDRGGDAPQEDIRSGYTAPSGDVISSLSSALERLLAQG